MHPFHASSPIPNSLCDVVFYKHETRLENVTDSIILTLLLKQYTLYSFILKITRKSFTVKNLREGQEYELRVTAENALGQSPPSDSVYSKYGTCMLKNEVRSYGPNNMVHEVGLGRNPRLGLITIF